MQDSNTLLIRWNICKWIACVWRLPCYLNIKYKVQQFVRSGCECPITRQHFLILSVISYSNLSFTHKPINNSVTFLPTRFIISLTGILLKHDFNNNQSIIIHIIKGHNSRIIYLISFRFSTKFEFCLSLPGHFVWSLNFPTPYMHVHDSSMFYQNIMGCLKSCSVMPCSWTAPTLKMAT